MDKSPFKVYQNFLSAEDCDKVAKAVRIAPSLDAQGLAMAIERFYAPAEQEIFEKFKPIIPDLENYYTGFKYRGTEHLVFQQFPVNGKEAEKPHCDNAVFKRKKWIRVKDRDLTGILWLKEYRETSPFDIEKQVMGGKLEFPIYNFGFQAQKGTLVIYPASERFICLTSTVLIGELQCVRFYICGEDLWIYDPAQYPGDFRTWFSNIV